MFKPVQGLGRCTTAAQLPSTPGHTFVWQVTLDTATGVLVTLPLEVPCNMPRGLYQHMNVTLLASCVGMDGKKYNHVKSMHADDKPDISGVWGTHEVPLTPDGPEVLCWRAPKEHREAVNAVKECGMKPTVKRVLPESPNQAEPWVIQYKLKKLRMNAEKEEELPQMLKQVAAQRQMEKDAQDYAEDFSVEPVVVTADDLDMLKTKYPGTFDIMERLAGDSEVPMVILETQGMKTKDSVAKRAEAKMRKALKDMASAASSSR